MSRKKRNAELLRSELFSIEQLKRHAVTLAGKHNIDSSPGPDKLLPRLDDNERVLLEAYNVVTAAVTPGQRVVPAEAWLLDNFYLIEQQIELARRHLPQGYSLQLPRLADGPSAGFPRIYDLALELISHMDGRVDIDNVTHLIAAYQTLQPLMLGELWAFPIMLQLALLENLRRVGLLIAHRREEIDAAVTWADRMLAISESDSKKLIQLLAEFANADVPLTAPFVEEFYDKLQSQGSTMSFVQAWVEQKLLEQGVTAAKLSERAGRRAAANQISIANSISSLRFIDIMDWEDFVESLSVVEHILREDPTATYAIQDFTTRDKYRHVIEDVARGCEQSEWDVAREAIKLAVNAAAQLSVADRSAHIGYYLIDSGRHLLERKVGYHLSWKMKAKRAGRRFRLPLYLGSILLLTTVATLLVLFTFGGFELTDLRYWLFALASLIGTSALAVSLVNMMVTLILPPRTLPRLDFSHGIPDAHRTMVVIPTLINNLQEIDDLLEALEIRYLGNRDSNLFFSLLTDFHDAYEQELPGDALLLAHARAAIQSLNSTYSDDRPCIFYFFHRPRVWNPHENLWIGYERKRGKLEQFNALLRGLGQSAFSELIGDMSILSSIKYVITLDTDTQLPRDAAHALIGNIAHPLNRPLYDPVKGRIVEGYSILQPRASISLNSARQTWFSKLFSGEPGIDPYTREVSDVYQDLFGEGSFIGKGIYDVDAFRLAVDGRFPENLILSHDLLESGYARSALVTDVDLIEEQPASYVIEASRRHRWIRGDWQLIDWLFEQVPGPPGLNGFKSKPQPNPLTALLGWKIFDNLRRSLVSPSLLALLVGGWLIGPGPAWFWLLVVAIVILLPSILGALIEIARKPVGRDWLVHLSLTSKSVGRPTMQALLALVFLPYDTLICLDAILSSGVRMLFTRRGLLLWHMKSYARRNKSHTLTDFMLEMWVSPLVALLVFIGLIIRQPAGLIFCAPVLIFWLLAPVVGWWISKPILPPVPRLTIDQQTFLRLAARRTWRFFADFVSQQDNWLPPDNYQESPVAAIASRTSPTNIGMSLLANLAAYDLGYITAGEFLRRTENTFATLEKLERYHGHFFNWYDTRTLQPLIPQYVSSVDSGNLAGCLLTLQAGLAEMKNYPLLSSNVFQGLMDTLQLFAEQLPLLPPDAAKKTKYIQDVLSKLALDNKPQTLTDINHLLDEIYHYSGELVTWLPADVDTAGELYYWAQAFDQQFRALRDELQYLMPEPQHYNNITSLSEIANAGESGSTSQSPDCTPTASNCNSVLDRLGIIDGLVARSQELSVMDFEFLYDTTCDLLSIGYDVGERRRDTSCYDLLASESRLASFLLIAQGQLPQKHWFSLGRLLTSYGGEVGLLSWSGSMFEYLMPQLLMPSYEHTLLDRTCKTAVLRQIEYGRQRAVPWGISESGYNVTDIDQVYQYRAFGVPGLGFKRGLADDLVIAPYASALALIVLPEEACRNLQTLAAKGFLGHYGFYEAIDYTPSRVKRGKNHSVVRSFMAHHQGMSLLAIEHVLLNQPMQRRFTSSPLVQATELLLQERVPKKGFTLHPHAVEASSPAISATDEVSGNMRVFTTPDTLIPEVHLLSNGRYHVMATNAGGGYSRWLDLAITRWREDATSDCWGTFIYLRDHDTGRYWSATYQPTMHKADHYEAIFVQARAEYRRRDLEIEAHTEVSVSPEDDIEIRRVTLTNLSSRIRHIEITSYSEVVLAALNADLAHRAFSNLFVQTEILHEKQAILCTRRPRAQGEKVSWMFHLLAAPGVDAGKASYETDRARFIGRGRTTANPEVFDKTKSISHLSNTDGSVLDPIVAIRNTFAIPPDKSAVVQIISGVADTREAALALLDKYCDRHFVERAFEMSWFQSQEVLRYINATEADAQIFGRLASSIIYSNALRRAAPHELVRNQLGQSGLWRFGVSGDLPIVLLRIGNPERIDLVKKVLQAHAYWRMKGLMTDLVIVNEDFSSYRASLQDRIVGLINTGSEAQIIDKPGGIFLRRAEELSEDERVLFQTVARIVFTDTAETLLEQTDRRVSVERASDLLHPWMQPKHDPVHPLPVRERIFFNSLGGFTPDGREYIITLEPGQSTPAPWVNVIASPHIGTVVSESGSAYTWVENAHEFRLTTWNNDTVSDISGEAFYIRDEETGEFWSPTPLPASGRHGYVCRHGFGYSAFEHDETGIRSEMNCYVAMDAPVKFVVIKLHNHSKRTRQLSLTGYWELVLGEWRHANLMHIVTESDLHSGAVFARNAYGKGCANRVVFAHVSDANSIDLERTVTGNRTEFIGRNGSLANPAAMRRKQLSDRTGAGFDPCAALQTKIELADGQDHELVFVFGAASDKNEAFEFIERFSRPADARQALDAVHGYWNHTLGAVQVETPDAALNVLANGWLLYQTLSSRLWGRSGYYQSGGAYGFRDQLQDTMALIHAAPWLAREQLIRCAERQFIQGDVQHWWHPPGGQGVRTHFSDDYLWLPYATCRYVLATGDTGILDESVHFLEGRELKPEEEAYYDQPQRSTEAASFYEHCVRAIKHGLRFGEHQLPLMGCGDWNDGMNMIGRDGKGESVWLAWFLYDNLQQFSALARTKQDNDFSNICITQSAQLLKNIEKNAWDGGWYRRAYFDDGTPLGSASNDECQIDSISQSWAIISKGGDPSRAKLAMTAVNQRLIKKDVQLIKLLDPPFDKSDLEPGYIKGYVPGVRENGGQYTHAAIWTTMAFAMLGDKAQAWELFSMLNPINHASHPEQMLRYKVEPYVMSADIYAAAPHTGRGGWTWYTGAAGWMYRLTVETLLGLHLEVDKLRITPCFPTHWQTYKIHYRFHETLYHITINHVSDMADQAGRVTVDGVIVGGITHNSEIASETWQSQAVIPLVNDQSEHYVEVDLS